VKGWLHNFHINVTSKTISSLLERKEKDKKIVYILMKSGIYGNIDRVLHEDILTILYVINISD